MPHLLLSMVFTDLAPSRKKSSSLFKCERAAAEPLSPPTFSSSSTGDEGREANQETHTHPPFALQNPQTRHPHALAIPPPAGLVTPILNLDLECLRYLFSCLCFFFHLSFSLVGSNLGTSCSSASSFRALLDRDKGFYFPSCYLMFPLLSLTYPAESC